jgi:putative restriction endonuclease
MPNYWWVNHKQTFRAETEGQYLWSPKTSKHGHQNEFYNNMRRAAPGELVLSYANQLIQYVGRVADFAFTAPKPKEFGATGENWSTVGWYLPVAWVPLVPAVRPRTLIAALAPHLPKRHSPIDPITGYGRQNAYLAEIPKVVFDLIISHASFDDLQLKQMGSNSLTFEGVRETLEDEIQQSIARAPDLDETTRKAVIQARRGQGRFRANVEAVEHSCRLTGIANPALLNASHIKPWHACESAEERLDGMNGLLLSPDADRLFDRGFISFEDHGEVLVSPRVDRDDLLRLGFSQLVYEGAGFAEAGRLWNVSPFLPEQQRYLSYHRSEIFLT